MILKQTPSLRGGQRAASPFANLKYTAGSVPGTHTIRTAK